VAVRSKAEVCIRYIARIASSKPVEVMDIGLL